MSRDHVAGTLYWPLLSNIISAFIVSTFTPYALLGVFRSKYYSRLEKYCHILGHDCTQNMFCAQIKIQFNLKVGGEQVSPVVILFNKNKL